MELNQLRFFKNGKIKILRILLWLFFWLIPFRPCFSAVEGKPAPAFEAKLLSGENFSLAKVSGQVVILHFWATWCDACRVEMPILDAYYKQHRVEGLQLIAISMDSAKNELQAREVMKSFSFAAGFAKDASFKSYGRIWRLPLTFIIDRKAILQKDGWTLDHKMTLADLEKQVDPLLKAKP